MNKTKKEAVEKIDRKLETLTLAEARGLVYEKFRANIRLLRAKEGWSGCEASEKIGLKNGKRIIDLEYGRANPTMEEMILISNCFKQSIDNILHKNAKVTFE